MGKAKKAEKGIETEKGAFTSGKTKRKESLLFVVNMTGVDRDNYWVGLPKTKKVKLLLTEEGLVKEDKYFPVVKGECDGRDYHIAYPLKGYGIALFSFIEEEEDRVANAKPCPDKKSELKKGENEKEEKEQQGELVAKNSRTA